MKVKFVSIENGIVSCGFRKMASIARSIHPETEVCYVPLTNSKSTYRRLMKGGDLDCQLSTKDVRVIAKNLAQSDMICFSSMTQLAGLTKEIINAIRAIHPDIYVVWGGSHPVYDPDDAILNADAICIGEGELAFQNFFFAYQGRRGYTATKNFWFNVNGKIIKNGFYPLHRQKEMDRFPFPLYAEDELIFKNSVGFVPLGIPGYLTYYGKSYCAIWTIGCPYKCNYCGNSKLIKNDSNYRKIRHSSVNYIIAEIKSVIKKHPFVSPINFIDDSFMAVPFATIEEFAEKWKKEINLPFSVYGITPGFVKKNKMEILIRAGMVRVRMGIQSGSDRILKFYNRPNKPGLILRATSTIAEFSSYMIPPAYDYILDNPIENRQDVVDTLELLYNTPRPFTLNIQALRIIPNTELANDFAKQNISHKKISESFLVASPTFANVLVHLLAVYKPPRRVFQYFLKCARPYSEPQTQYPKLLFIVRAIWLFKRGLDHLRFMDFSAFGGKTGWFLWKLGIIRFWQKWFVRKYVLAKKKAN